MYRIIYNQCCFYWAVLDEHGAEVAYGLTYQDAENALHRLEK